MKKTQMMAAAGTGIVLAMSCLSTSAMAEETNTPTFSFGAYMRSGAGTTSDGGSQACFRLPGAATFFRLGNECDSVILASNLVPLTSPRCDPSFRST